MGNGTAEHDSWFEEYGGTLIKYERVSSSWEIKPYDTSYRDFNDSPVSNFFEQSKEANFII